MKVSPRRCDFCLAEEGKPRPIGNYKVKLQIVEVLDTKKLACQSCRRNYHNIINKAKNDDLLAPKKSWLAWIKNLAKRVWDK